MTPPTPIIPRYIDYRTWKDVDRVRWQVFVVDDGREEILANGEDVDQEAATQAAIRMLIDTLPIARQLAGQAVKP